MIAAELASLLKATPRGKWFETVCPEHDDRTPSLNFRDGDRGIIFKCHAGCPSKAVAEAMARRVSASVGDFFSGDGHGAAAGRSARIIAEYNYRDERGQLIYQVVRREPKDFRLRRPDGRGGWTWNLDGVRRVVYRLDELAEAERAYLNEGEKPTEALVALGLRATTSPGGAKGWRRAYAEQLVQAGLREVVILPDNDAPGRAYARQAATDLWALGLTVRVLALPDLPDKGDVVEWLAAGHTREELEALVASTPAWDGRPLDDGPDETREGDDVTFRWAEHAVEICVSACHEGSEGLHAEITVQAHGAELHWSRLNLTSTPAREGLRKKLDEAAPAVPWRELLERVCRRAATLAREGEPVVELRLVVAAREPYLVEPFAPRGETSLLFGDGGAGKSLLLTVLALAVATGKTLPGGIRPTLMGPVLLVDYETCREEKEEIVAHLAAGLGIHAGDLGGRIHYHAMSRALADEGRRLRADVMRLGVVLLGVDSAGPAAGSEPESADSAIRLMNTLRSVGAVTRMMVAHLTKVAADQRGPARPIGSVYYQNIARSVWELRRSAEDTDDDLVIGLYHRKVNRGRLHAPLSLRFHFEPDRITMHSADLAEAPDLLARTSLPHRIRAILASGAQPTQAVVEGLDAAEATVTRTLRRLAVKNQIIRIGPTPAGGQVLWGLPA